ncbi:hypothetical protein [Bradyrhizobium liaoningense]|uniref:hypothetical protein n=1 Tax=Bradyrhizobium liaoningense TaxID=43992 RepID=UPI001BAD6D2C|nr:hypothetical protein [Bradyrhizobium liaoningense]MBR0714163.1 hypothetical protein [Bradyrhizobium liaoningense]
MTVAVTLLLASLIAGLATGLLFRVWALLLVSPLIAVVSAIVLQTSGFEFFAGVSVIVGCLVVSQLAYMLATFHLHRWDLSAEDEIDGHPGGHRQKNIRGQNE